MKKALLLVVLSIITFTSIKPTMASEYDVPYSGYASQSEYDYITKDENGLWYGVITITDGRTFAVNTLPEYGVVDTYYYFAEFELSRETVQLSSITIEFTINSYCPYITCIFGGRIDESTETKTYTYDESSMGLEEGKTLEEAFGEGSIVPSIDEDYHYVVDLGYSTQNKETGTALNIITMYFVLTDAEVQALLLDIQEQYELEYLAIINNNLLTSSEKQSQINSLNMRYSEYDISFGEEMGAGCIGEECEWESIGHPELPDIGEVFDLVKFFEEYFPKGADLIGYIITILIIGYITGTIIFKGTQKAVYTILDGIFSGIKSIAVVLLKAIWYYIDALFSGIGTILGSILNGFMK